MNCPKCSTTVTHLLARTDDLGAIAQPCGHQLVTPAQEAREHAKLAKAYAKEATRYARIAGFLGLVAITLSTLILLIVVLR